MPAPLVDPQNLEAWLGRGTLSTTDYSRAVELIDRVSALIRAEAPTNIDEIEGGVPDAVRGLALTISARIWDNPTFKNSKTTGPFTDSWRDVGLYLTDEERRLLHTAIGSTSMPKGIGTLSTTRGDLETASVLDDCAVAFEDLELE